MSVYVCCRSCLSTCMMTDAEMEECMKELDDELSTFDANAGHQNSVPRTYYVCGPKRDAMGHIINHCGRTTVRHCKAVELQQTNVDIPVNDNYVNSSQPSASNSCPSFNDDDKCLQDTS